MTDASPSGPIASAGKIHLLDFTGLRERFGSKWERMAQHVEMFFEAAIRRALKPGDTFCRSEEFSYLLMFRELSAAEAEFKCATISEEVCRRLFGESGEPIALRNLVAFVGLATIPSGAAPEAELSALLEREGRETVITRDTRTAVSSALRPGTERTSRLASDGSSDSRVRVSAAELTFAYRPIWDAYNRVVLTYLCQPARSLGSASDAVNGFCSADTESDQMLLDSWVLEECMARSVRLRAAGFRIILAVPVHFTTIAQPRIWREYSAALHQIPDEIARDFAFVVFGIDHGVPHIRLTQELPKLSKKAYRVFCAIDWWQGAGTRFAGTGAHGLGAALGENDDELQAISRLREVARGAQAAAMDSFILGLRSTSLALISIHSGIRYLEGPVVRPAVDDPRHGFAHGVEDLYRAKRLTS